MIDGYPLGAFAIRRDDNPTAASYEASVIDPSS